MNRCGPLDDVVVDALTLKTYPRTEQWVDAMRVPAAYTHNEECPIWTKCLDDWSGGDPAWQELLQRWMGYCLIPTRRFARWLLLYGKIRGGKQCSIPNLK